MSIEKIISIKKRLPIAIGTAQALIVLPLLLLLGLPAAAQVPDSLLAALEEHPQVQQYKNEYESLAAGAQAAGFLPEPRLGMGYFIQPIETRVGPQRLRLSLSQAFPWPGTLAAMRNQSTARAAEAWFRYRDMLSRQQEALSLAWEELTAHAALLAVEAANDSLLREMEQVLLYRYESGNLPLNQILYLRMMRKSSEVNLLKRQNNLESAWRQVLLIAGLNTAAALPAALQQEQLELSNERLLPADHPAGQALEARLAMMESRQDLARLQARPSLSAGIDYIITAPRTDMNVPDNGKNALAPMLSLSIPIYGKKYKEEQKAAGFAYDMVTAAKEALRNDFALRWERAQTARDNARLSLQLGEAQQVQASEALDLSRVAFENDQADLNEVYAWQERLLQWQQQVIMARKEMNKAIRQLQYLQVIDAGILPQN